MQYVQKHGKKIAMHNFIQAKIIFKKQVTVNKHCYKRELSLKQTPIFQAYKILDKI